MRWDASIQGMGDIHPCSEVGMSNMSDHHEPTKSVNFVVRLFRGDVSLPITYWLFGYVAGLAFFLGFRIYESNYASVALFGSTGLKRSLLLVSIVGTAYGAFIMIAIWRSAGKHRGSRLWSTVARITAFVAALIWMAEAASVFNQAVNSTAAIQEELALMNKSLPIMLDDVTRLDPVSLQSEDIHYDYTITNVSADGSTAGDIERFHAVMTAQLKTSACGGSDTRPLLEEGRKLVHVYRDEQSNLFARITIGESDCSVVAPPRGDT